MEAESNFTKMVVDVNIVLPPTPDPVIVDVKEITVTKVWSDGVMAHLKDNVKVGLYANGELVGEQIVLSPLNQWTYKWDELPRETKDHNIIVCTIKEESNVEGYTTTIQKEKEDNFIVLNKKVDAPPIIDNIVTGTTQTGDNQIGLALVLSTVCAVMFSGFAIRVHRRRNM